MAASWDYLKGYSFLLTQDYVGLEFYIWSFNMQNSYFCKNKVNSPLVFIWPCSFILRWLPNVICMFVDVSQFDLLGQVKRRNWNTRRTQKMPFFWKTSDLEGWGEDSSHIQPNALVWSRLSFTLWNVSAFVNFILIIVIVCLRFDNMS